MFSHNKLLMSEICLEYILGLLRYSKWSTVQLHLGSSVDKRQGPSWPWKSYGSWIYNYLCNQCLSPLIWWVQIYTRARCTTLCDKVCHWLAAGRWFSPGPPVSSTNKTDCHDIAEILLKVALNTTNKHRETSVLLSYVDGRVFSL